MGFKQHISRTWQMIEQQVNDVPFRPDNEDVREIKRIEMLINTVFFECNKSVQDVYFHDFSMNMEL